MPQQPILSLSLSLSLPKRTLPFWTLGFLNKLAEWRSLHAQFLNLRVQDFLLTGFLILGHVRFRPKYPPPALCFWCPCRRGIGC